MISAYFHTRYYYYASYCFISKPALLFAENYLHPFDLCFPQISAKEGSETAAAVSKCEATSLDQLDKSNSKQLLNAKASFSSGIVATQTSHQAKAPKGLSFLPSGKSSSPKDSGKHNEFKYPRKVVLRVEGCGPGHAGLRVEPVGLNGPGSLCIVLDQKTVQAQPQLRSHAMLCFSCMGWAFSCWVGSGLGPAGPQPSLL